MGPIDEYHEKFHNILGHLTTIRSVISVIVDDRQDEIPADLRPMLMAANQHAADLVKELEVLREKLYSELKITN